MLETLLHQSPFGVVVIGRDRRIRWANQYACELVGVGSDADLRGKLCSDYLCPVGNHPCPMLDEGQEVKHSERILRRADGTEISILKTVTEIKLNHESVLLETFVDISEQQRATYELRQTLDEQEAIFESSLVGIMVLENRILTKVNRRMAEMLGYEPAEMVGRGPQQLHLSMKNFHEFGE
jgi:PAS domain S-box-containing protein